MAKINKTNYFHSTMGTFKSIPKIWTQTLTTVGVHTPCCLGERIWRLAHISNDSKRWSGYWVSDDDSSLIRISNHWCYIRSKKNGGNTKIIPCKNIHSNIWRLKHGINKNCVFDFDNTQVIGGVINFEKLKGKM